MTVRRVRMLMVYVAVALILWLLSRQNPNISPYENFQKAQPFLLSSVAFGILLLTLWVRFVIPPHVKWWQVWKWVDPLTISLSVLIFCTMCYQAALWLGQSLRYTVSPDIYDALRLGLWVSGFATIGIGIELLIAAVRARRSRTIQRNEFYDEREQPV